MDPMIVRVKEISLDTGVLAALVTATSRQRFKGQPIARTQISLRLPAKVGESSRGDA
jgi:hypothetical protein